MPAHWPGASLAAVALARVNQRTSLPSSIASCPGGPGQLCVHTAAGQQPWTVAGAWVVLCSNVGWSTTPAACTLHCRRFPTAPLLAAGYSLGSILLTKYVAEADLGLFEEAGSQQAPGAPAAAQTLPPGAQPSFQTAPGAASSSSRQARSEPAASTSGRSGRSGSYSSRAEQAAAAAAEAAAGGVRLRGSGLVATVLVSSPVCIHATNAKLSKAWNFEVCCPAYSYLFALWGHCTAGAVHPLACAAAAVQLPQRPCAWPPLPCSLCTTWLSPTSCAST